MASRHACVAAIALICLACGYGCGTLGTRPATSPLLPPIPDRFVALNGHDLRLHFSRGTGGLDRPLLVYATGDGGWHRRDLAAYHHLVSFGYPTIGFDARDYVTHLGAGEATTPGRLAADYERIIETARSALQLPTRYPVVLVGISRGAGLSVVAAAQPGLRPSIAGVLAVALTKEEEYVRVRWLQRLGRRAATPQMVEVYDYLHQLADMPVAVVQSTRDGYLPADRARALFGPDAPLRWLQPIEARNHSFGGARAELYEALGRALTWIDGLRATERQWRTRGRASSDRRSR
jgi:hypothetical protein